MDPMQTDLFATKGLEYLLVIGYLILLTGFWTLALRAPRKAEAKAGARERSGARSGGWFSLPDGFHFHRGHAWALKEAPGLLRVGMDEFSRRLVGNPSSLVLPGVGDHLEQGGTGWTVVVDGKPIRMLSPVKGEVLEVNPAALETPEAALQDPYDKGWLLKVRVDPERCPLRNLLSGNLALAWLRDAEEQIRTFPSGGLGVALPDGGEPVDGFARALAPERWDVLAEDFLRPGPC